MNTEKVLSTKIPVSDIQKSYADKNHKTPPKLNKNMIIGIGMALVAVVFVTASLASGPAPEVTEKSDNPYINPEQPDIAAFGYATPDSPEPTDSGQGIPLGKISSVQKAETTMPHEMFIEPSARPTEQPSRQVSSGSTVQPQGRVLYQQSETPKPAQSGPAFDNSGMTVSVSAEYSKIRPTTIPGPMSSSPAYGQANTSQPYTQSGGASADLNGYSTQNGQAQKAAFTKQNNFDFTSPIKALTTQYPSFSLLAPAYIPAILTTDINSDLPGEVTAMVTNNVYDTVSGKNILIPQGTMLLATYNSVVTNGQSRIQVSWQRMRRPDGFTLDFGGMTGVDSSGASGFNADIDPHILNYLASLGIGALQTVVTAEILAAKDQLYNPTQIRLLDQGNQYSNDLANKLLDQASNVQPTLRVRQGTKVNVMVTQDLLLPPAQNTLAPTKYTATK